MFCWFQPNFSCFVIILEYFLIFISWISVSYRNLIIRYLIQFRDKNVNHSKYIVEDSSIPSLHCPRDINILISRLWLRLLSVESIKLIAIFLINFSLWTQGKSGKSCQKLWLNKNILSLQYFHYISPVWVL